MVESSWERRYRTSAAGTRNQERVSASFKTLIFITYFLFNSTLTIETARRPPGGVSSAGSEAISLSFVVVTRRPIASEPDVLEASTYGGLMEMLLVGFCIPWKSKTMLKMVAFALWCKTLSKTMVVPLPGYTVCCFGIERRFQRAMSLWRCGTLFRCFRPRS